MSKRKIEVVYDKNLSKEQLYQNAKQEIKYIYDSLKNQKQTKKDKEFYDLLSNIDKNKDSYFRVLFLLSLYCNYFHKIKDKINIAKLDSSLISECYKKNNFFILDTQDNHLELLNDISTFFNTDAINIEEITGKILYDIYNINIQLKPQ